MAALALVTFRECFRRPFPYVLTGVMALLTLASHLFQAFSFGAGALESANLALSAVFLSGVAFAGLVGTGLIRGDVERGTMGLVLTKPPSLAVYLAARLAGLALATALVCVMVAAASVVVFLLPFGPPAPPLLDPALFLGWGRALLAVIVLDAVALAISAFAARTFAPVLFLFVLVVGSLGGGPLLPALSVFGLEAGAAPPMGTLMLYTGVYTTAFLLLAFVLLASRSPLRSQA